MAADLRRHKDDSHLLLPRRIVIVRLEFLELVAETRVHRARDVRSGVHMSVVRACARREESHLVVVSNSRLRPHAGCLHSLVKYEFLVAGGGPVDEANVPVH